MKVMKSEYALGLIADDDYVTGGLAVTTSSQQFTLPEVDGWYIITSTCGVFMEGGTLPTVVAGAGGFSMLCPANGVVGPIRLRGAKVAYICAAGDSGFMSFIHLVPTSML